MKVTKKQQEQAIRDQVIDYLSTQVVEKAQLNKGGSACIVPSVSEDGKFHRVELNEDYLIDSCDCKGGKHECQHKAAVRRYMSAKFEARPELLDKEANPVYKFQRGGVTVKARLSQFSKEEKKALRQYEQEAAKRAIYEQAFNPNCVA